MKILQFIYSLCPGGAERFTVDLSNELAKKHDVTLYTFRDEKLNDQGFYKSLLSDQVRIINLKIPPGFNPRIVYILYRILKKESPDIVHMHLSVINYFLILSAIFKNKIKFVYTIHTLANYEIRNKTELLIRRYVFKRSFISPVTISLEVLKSYKECYKHENAHLIINGRAAIEKSVYFDEARQYVAGLRNTDDTVIFCHIARLDPNKNQKMLISVMNNLKNEGYDIHLIMIGGGFDNSKEIMDIAGDNIHFLGSKLNATDYLFLSDALCLSSVVEGMPITLIEALACGCTPICTPVGGMKDTIKNGINGYISSSTNESDYSSIVKEYLSNRNVICQERLVQYYHDHFSMKNCSANYEQLYNSTK